MDRQKIEHWLLEKNIKLEEDFSETLVRYAKEYKKNNIKNLKDVYALLQICPESVYRWQKNRSFHRSTIGFKVQLIKRMGEIFLLSEEGKLRLYNQAGLVSYEYDKLVQKKEFIISFKKVISTYHHKKVDLCNKALVSERMFRHIQRGEHLSKSPILALLITMGLEIETISEVLSSAGFILSPAIIEDVIVLEVIQKHKIHKTGEERLVLMNELLENFALPLLMTRQ